MWGQSPLRKFLPGVNQERNYKGSGSTRTVWGLGTHGSLAGPLAGCLAISSLGARGFTGVSLVTISPHLSTRCVFGDINIFAEVGCQIVLGFSFGFIPYHVNDLIQRQSIKQSGLREIEFSSALPQGIPCDRYPP